MREPELRDFESFDGRRIPYLLYGRPGQPTLCFVHGGPESQYRGSLNPVVAYLVSRGIAVAAPNVRGSTGYGRDYHHLDDVELRLDSVRDLAELARSLGAGDRRAGGRDGRELRRLHDDGCRSRSTPSSGRQPSTSSAS